MKHILQKFFLFFITIFPSLAFTQGTCNNQVTWTTNNFNGLTANSSLGSFSNRNNVIDADLTNSASWGSIVINPTAWIEVKKNDPQPAGVYAGVVLSDFAAVNLSSTYTLETYMGNNKTGDNIEISFPINLATSTNRSIGLISTQPFDRIRLSINAVGVATFDVNYFYTITPCPIPTGLDCNQSTAITQDKFPAVINYKNGNTGLSGLSVGSINNLENIVNKKIDDFGTISLGIAVNASAKVAVKDLTSTFEGGSFAGFDIENSNLLDIGLLNGTKIQTYLKGVLQEASTDNSILLNLSLLGGSNRGEIGFVTTKDFDEVQLVQTNLLGLDIFGSTKIYSMVVRKNCKGPDPLCNTDTNIVLPNYPASIQNMRTGVGGITVASVNNANNVINSNINDYAEINVTASVIGNASLSVFTTGQTFDAGSFAGFQISNTNILNINLLNNITIKTYLNGIFQEESSNNSLLLDVGLLGGTTPRNTVGFVTTKPFDEVQFVMSTVLSVDLLGSTRIYSMVVKKFCEGNPFSCNVNTLINKQDYPVYIGKNTGITGAVTLGDISEIDNILDNDPSTFASINIPVSVLSSATIAVKKELTPFEKGSYVSFDVELASLVEVSLLTKFKIRLLRNGALVNEEEGGNFLLGANVATSGRKTLGIKANDTFNEVQLILNQPVGVSLGTVKIYDLNIIKPCQNGIDCNDDVIIEDTPDHRVVINHFKTGIEGIICAQCEVRNSENLLSPNSTDFTTLSLGVGVAGSAGVSVLDLSNIYPTGTYVGFTMNDNPNWIQADVFESFTIKTYLNGILQESKISVEIIDLSIIFTIGTGKLVRGFKTTKPFNEVKLEVKSLASVINNIEVYNLIINTQDVPPTNNDGNLICVDDTCVKPGDFSSAGVSSISGISTLARPNSNWPAEIPNGFIVLESKDKGMVITRVQNSTMIADPKEGMLIYDTTANCVKLYNGNTWKCIKKSCNN